jgi:hypothetical protein
MVPAFDGFLPDLIDAEQDAVPDAARFDPSLALPLAPQHIGHRQNGLERIPLAPSGWTDDGFL